MRILVVSDSHGSTFMLDKAIKRAGEIDYIFHLGDGFKDLIKLNEKYNKKIEYVKGNCDFTCEVEEDKLITIGEIRLFLTHGSNYNVKCDLLSLYYKALETEVDIVLYGHTHIQDIERTGDVLFVNPGSIARPKGSKPGYIIITIEGKKFDIFSCEISD